MQPVLDMNVVPVYFELQITGKGVNITVPDDGLDFLHPEIFPRFVSPPCSVEIKLCAENYIGNVFVHITNTI